MDDASDLALKVRHQSLGELRSSLSASVTLHGWLEVTTDVLDRVILKHLLFMLADSHVWQDDILTEGIQRFGCGKHLAAVAHPDNDREEAECSGYKLLSVTVAESDSQHPRECQGQQW